MRSDAAGVEEQERERRRQVTEKFQKAPFEELAAHCESKVTTAATAPGVTTPLRPNALSPLRHTCCTTGWRRSLSSPSGKVTGRVEGQMMGHVTALTPPPPTGPPPAPRAWWRCPRATRSISQCPSTR